MTRHPLRMLALAALAASVTTPSGIAAQDADAVPGLRIDRWLVSDPIAVDSIDASGEARILSGSGEFGVLPRRGEEVAGTRWTLVRTDSVSTPTYVAHLDSLGGYVVEPAAVGTFIAARDSVAAPYVMFAHAYVRSPEDRNVVLSWLTRTCSQTDLRLNGSRVYGLVGVHGHGPGVWDQHLSAEVRLAAGWNTLLLRVHVPEPQEETPEACGRIDVKLLPARGDTGTLDGFRVQASRPPGQVRTGPEPWVVITRFLSPAPTWRSGRVTMDVPVILTAFGRSVLDSARVRIRGPDTDLRTTRRDLHVGRPDTVVVRFPIEQVADLAQPGSIRIEVRWKDSKIEERLSADPAGLEDPLGGFLKLDGWRSKLPDGPGLDVRGEWIVPAELAGRTLLLRTTMAEATYSVNGQSQDAGHSITLCSECSAGAAIEISAVSTAAWSDFPVLIVQ